jgi:Fe2+ transport system protein FeoA
MSIRLTELKRYESGKVIELGGSEAVQNRFKELGIFPGTTVSCYAKGALGGPLLVSCRGAKIALRSHAAQHIVVEQTAA